MTATAMPPASTVLSRAHNLGPIERIPPGEARTFRLEGVEIAVFRGRDGSVYATQAACPHREGPLADGLAGGGVVICPLHAYKFRLADGKAIGHDCGDLAVYRAWLDGAGCAWVEANKR